MLEITIALIAVCDRFIIGHLQLTNPLIGQQKLQFSICSLSSTQRKCHVILVWLLCETISYVGTLYPFVKTLVLSWRVETVFLWSNFSFEMRIGLLIKQINHNGWDESWNVVELFCLKWWSKFWGVSDWRICKLIHSWLLKKLKNLYAYSLLQNE